MDRPTIKLSTALAELDENVLPDGKQKIFSIKFIKKNGELVYFKRAVKTGLNKVNLKANNLVGVLPIDESGKSISHPTPVVIWNIVGFNGKRVYL